MEHITLYRPVGPVELKLIEDTQMKAFPPRLLDQPIFYPVTTRHYAQRIAREWNVPASGSGFVTEFDVPMHVTERWPIQEAAGRDYTELWVPAEELDLFNSLIIGEIRVIDSYS